MSVTSIGPGVTGVPVPGREAAVRRRRRPVLWALGVAVVVVTTATGVLLVERSGDRVAVLAVGRAVPVGQAITGGDLRVARVAEDSGLTPVRASDRDRVVGRVAAVELRPGTLLTAEEVTDATVPGAGEQVVGVALRAGQLPARGLRPGDRVLVVPVPGDQSTSGGGSGAAATVGPTGESVRARVVQVGAASTAGTVTVDLVVGQDVGERVAALASTGRVVLVLLPAGS